MLRIAGPLLACMFALANAPANAQAGATPAPENMESAQPSTASGLREASAQPATSDDVCRHPCAQFGEQYLRVMPGRGVT